MMPQEVADAQDPALSPSQHAPNIQTSLAVVKRRKLMDSGDIHLMGRRVMDAAGREKIVAKLIAGQTEQPWHRQGRAGQGIEVSAWSLRSQG